MFPIIEIQRAAAVVQRSDELKARQHLFIISDETPDSHGTVFKLAGWNLSMRAMKKKVTYGHPRADDTDDTNIIGIGEETISDKLYSLLTLEEEKTNPKAERIHQKLLLGSLTDASVRCLVEDGRMGNESLGENPKLFYYTISHLKDWGVVNEGSNFETTKVRSAELEDFIKSKVPVKYHSHVDIIRAMKVKYYF